MSNYTVKGQVVITGPDPVIWNYQQITFDPGSSLIVETDLSIAATQVIGNLINIKIVGQNGINGNPGINGQNNPNGVGAPGASGSSGYNGGSMPFFQMNAGEINGALNIEAGGGNGGNGGAGGHGGSGSSGGSGGNGGAGGNGGNGCDVVINYSKMKGTIKTTSINGNGGAGGPGGAGGNGNPAGRSGSIGATGAKGTSPIFIIKPSN